MHGDSLVHEADAIKINAVKHKKTHLSILESRFLKNTKTSTFHIYDASQNEHS